MKSEKRALKALDGLYSSGYSRLRNHNLKNDIKIEGFFFSDCWILFVRNMDLNLIVGFSSLLDTIKQIYQDMMEKDFTLMTSIAYGQFKYQNRIEFTGIEKNPVYGNAYVSAYLDTERNKNKIQPGQCRIVIENLPQNLIDVIERGHPADPFSLIKTRRGDNQHFYFYWMVNESHQIDNFEQIYQDSYNLKYTGMLQALKNAQNNI